MKTMLRGKVSCSDFNESVASVTSLKHDRVTPKRIMAFGDSNTFRPKRGKTRWTELLKKKDPVNIEIFNESFDGRTTKYDNGECNGLNVIENKLASNAPLNYVIVMLGTNDVKSKYGPPNVSDIAHGIRGILDIIDAQGNGIEPILITPPPLGNVTSGNLAGIRSLISLIVNKYKLLAMSRDIRFINIYSIINSSTDLDTDAIHLNAMGRQKIANSVWENLQKMTSCTQVTGFFGIAIGDKLKLTWNPAGYDTFYYRIRRNGDVIGRTMNASFVVKSHNISDSFTVEAVDFSQNTGMVSGLFIHTRTSRNR